MCQCSKLIVACFTLIGKSGDVVNNGYDFHTILYLDFWDCGLNPLPLPPSWILFSLGVHTMCAVLRRIPTLKTAPLCCRNTHQSSITAVYNGGFSKLWGNSFGLGSNSVGLGSRFSGCGGCGWTSVAGPQAGTPDFTMEGDSGSLTVINSH